MDYRMQDTYRTGVRNLCHWLGLSVSLRCLLFGPHSSACLFSLVHSFRQIPNARSCSITSLAHKRGDQCHPHRTSMRGSSHWLVYDVYGHDRHGRKWRPCWNRTLVRKQCDSPVPIHDCKHSSQKVTKIVAVAA
jgi:hypothetical protein